MNNPSFLLLYVENPSASAVFYTVLLCQPPVESSDGFVLFALQVPGA